MWHFVCDSVEPLLVNSPVLFLRIDSLCYTREQQSLGYADRNTVAFHLEQGPLQDVRPAKV